MARTVRDVKILFDAMAGPDIGDPMSSRTPIRHPAESEIRGLRIGYFEDDGRIPVTPKTRSAIRRAADALKQSGFAVDQYLPEDLEPVRRIWWNLFGRAGQFVMAPMSAGRESDLSPILREFIRIVGAEPEFTLGEFMNTLIERDVIRGRFLSAMEYFPVLLCPVCAVPAFRHGEREWQIEGKKVKYLDAMSYSQWFNALGLPAIVVPVGRSPEGLPIGVQIVGRPYEEEIILAIAQKLEDACGDLREPVI